MLATGEIVSSTYFPEVVEIKKYEKFGDYFIIEAVGKETSKYYELLLERDQIATFQSIQLDESSNSLQASDVQKYILYLSLQNEVKYSNTKALGNSEVIPLPHQIEAVYSRMLQTPLVRFLLADDPGAGKTIMAGMIIKELLARLSIERVLILVPPLVLKQWQEELHQKFGLDFHIINRGIVNEYGGKNPFVENNFCLASMHWSIQDDVRALIQEADFDFVIVDEAHKMAAYTHGTTKEKVVRTKLYQLGEAILCKAPHCLLLTATPHKGDTENFRHLMRLIDEDVFSSNSINKNLREKANPFVIRRLKENLIHFDGTPIFPKRTTKTIQFQLTEAELKLYDAVTEYVRHYFNRAINNGNNSTAFAMMLLQRRLSSSLAAIDLSLKRRHERLEQLYNQTEAERKRFLRRAKSINAENYLDESNDVQEKVESELEISIDEIDLVELQKELTVLKDLIQKTENVRLYTVERKYQELEETLFDEQAGLLNKGEKIIIFTESVDTLRFLEERLLQHVPSIAKIKGSLSMEQRRQQVNHFRNKCQIMLATDAGGESINLQFCNQIINYDIPWNPNKLEQRMGRIHRIGQKNEVFVFNLVAKNTREGSVMVRLLEKMGQMRTDLGSDLVYDFVGEILEDKYDSLANLMQDAILHREKLDEVIADLDQTLADENKNLLKLIEEEQMIEDQLDLTDLKRETNTWLIERIPRRAYTEFTVHALESQRVRITKSAHDQVFRIDRLPKFIRDQMPSPKVSLNHSHRFTSSLVKETEDIPLISDIHPLFKIGMDMQQKEVERQAWKSYKVTANILENLHVEIFEISIVDGVGDILENKLVHLATRDSGEVIELNPNWIFYYDFVDQNFKEFEQRHRKSLNVIMKYAKEARNNILLNREKQLNKIQQFLEQAFNQQYRDTLTRLQEYQADNIDNRNSALINQMNAKLIDLDLKKKDRLNLISRQKNVAMKPPSHIITLNVNPNGRSKRLLADDYIDMIVAYERKNGRLNVNQYGNLGLVDFSSERFNGEERFIIISDDPAFILTDREFEDLHDILDELFIYIVDERKVLEEIRVVNTKMN